MSKEFNTRVKHKIDTYENWSKATNFIPLKGELIVYSTNEWGENKTGFKTGDGVTTVVNLPFINRPFYSLPPEYNFKFRATKKFDSITWDGDISNTPPEVTITPAEYANGIRFFKVAEQTLNFDDVLNSIIYASVPMDIGDGIELNYGYYALKITSDLILYQDTDFFISQYLVLANKAGTLTLDVGADSPVSAEFKEPGIYFFYMEDGNDIGYGVELSGAFDIEASTDLWVIPNILGEGTILACDKVYDNFLEKDMLLNSTIGMYMVAYDNNSDSQCLSIIINQDMFDNMGLITLADGSWYLSMNGIPLLASIKTPGIDVNGIIIEEAGVYLVYVNTETGNKDGAEIWLDHWVSPERVFQIDPKFIPKNDIAIQSNWEQMDSEKSDYIKNKPFDYQYIYGYNFNEVQNSEIKIYFDSANYPNSYFGLVKDMVFEDGGYIKLESIYVDVNGTSKYLPSTEIYSSSRSQYSISVSEDNDFITGSTTLMVYIKEPGDVDLRVNGNYYYLNFPKKGIYYLYTEDFGFYLKDIGYYYYFNADSNYQADWSQTNSSHPGFIKNKPNITTTSEINSYSSNPVSSSGVYYALGGRSSISTTSSVSSGSNSLVTSGGVYSALQNVKVTTDSSVSSSSTNPIQSKAIYTALGNRTSITTQAPTSNSNNLITSGQVYTALGYRTSLPTISSTVSYASDNLITSGGVYTALGNRTSLTFDDTPTSGSSDLMTSGAIYTALQNIEIDVDDSITETSTNPVSSAAIYEAINNISISEADTVDGYHFRVSTETPLSKDVTEKTITFVI